MPNDSSIFFNEMNHNYFFYKVLCYSVLLSIVLIFSYIVVSVGLPDNDADSSRYMVSALIQSEAAILAIVITLSIFAIQQSSSTYSTRIIQIFKNRKQNPDYYIIMGIYIITIVHGCWVLKQIRGEDIIKLNSITFSSFDTHIWLVYALGTFSFVSLVPYTLHTLNLLNPTEIIDKLSIDINETNLKKEPKNDYILPIIDIIRKSLIEYDYETSRYGLEKLAEKLMPLFSDENIIESDKEILFDLFFNHMMKVGRLAVSKKDETFVIDLLKLIESIIPLRIENLENRKVLISLIAELGIESTNQKLKQATEKAVNLFDEKFIQIPNAKKHEDVVGEVFSSLILIGEIAFKQKMERLSLQVLDLIYNIIESTILNTFVIKEVILESKQINIKYLLETFFQTISEIAFDTKSKPVLTRLSHDLKQSGIHTISKGWDNMTLDILKWLVEIGEFAIEEKNMKKLENDILVDIRKICDTAVRYRNEPVALNACESEIKLKPDSFETWVNKGNVLNNLGMYLKAIGAYEKANQMI
jgi:tetratricopeptide (TPR) repeat protein